MGFMLMGRQLGDQSLHQIGRHFVNFSLIVFAGFAFLFEIVIGISGRGPINALILIGLGLFLIARGTLRQRTLAALDSKPKRKVKRDSDKLFTGPVVYGTRVTSRLSVSEKDNASNRFDSDR
jgi:hypothetical protein